MTSKWADFVGKIQEKGPALASVLQHGNLFDFGPEGVRLGYERSTFYWESVHDSESRELITRQLEEYFGQPVSFSVVEADKSQRDRPATLAEMVAQDGAEKLEQMRDDAIAHPAVQGVISVLGGEVEQVVPLEASP